LIDVKAKRKPECCNRIQRLACYFGLMLRQPALFVLDVPQVRLRKKVPSFLPKAKIPTLII